MTDQKLDELLEEAFKQEVTVKPSLVYKARSRAREELARKEFMREQYPFLIILVLNTLIIASIILSTLVLIGGKIFLFASIICSVGFMFINVPVIVYLLAKLYYKDQENLKEE